MKYRNILITGGAGFVGSYLSIGFKENFPDLNVIVLDNLHRSGSDINVPRLEKKGIKFIRGDVRSTSDLKSIGKTDLLIECSAEPSVMAGVGASPEYLIQTNLFGAVNCFEYAREFGADVLFLSTSRIYPFDRINALEYDETDTRYVLSSHNRIRGIVKSGFSEDFPLTGYRSMYGATKLSAEYLLQEYIQTYQIKGVINRFGVIAGPWQMGKVDQGFISHWLSAFIYDKQLAYFGFGGMGKQVRDILHIDDVFNVILQQLKIFPDISGRILNISGGLNNSISLRELTGLCADLTGKKLNVKSDKNNRPNDVIYYIGDSTAIRKILNWQPKKDIHTVLADTYGWMRENKTDLERIFRQ